MKRSYEIDMCNGPLLGKIASIFSLSSVREFFSFCSTPRISWWWGSSPAATPIAAVGSTSALNNLIINVFLGFSIGCSILTARYYGAQKWQDVHEVVHTSMLLSVICGAAMIVIGIALARPLLEVMGTPG